MDHSKYWENYHHKQNINKMSLHQYKTQFHTRNRSDLVESSGTYLSGDGGGGGIGGGLGGEVSNGLGGSVGESIATGPSHMVQTDVFQTRIII